MSSGNMNDRDGWRAVTCTASDAIREGRKPVSSLTDMDGTYGPKVIYTEWADADGCPVLRDYLWMDAGRKCEHLVPEGAS